MFTHTSDHEVFLSATKRFLDQTLPPGKLRELGETAAGYDSDTWRRGAERGWTSLLVPEAAGGGAVSGRPVDDLLLVAWEFGHRAASGPFVPSNLVAAALGRWGNDDQQAGALETILSGDAVGAWAMQEPAPRDGLGEVTLAAESRKGGFVLSGTKSPVEAGGEADHILVAARQGHGLTQFLVPRDQAGLCVTPLRGLDMTRRFARLQFDDVWVGSDAVVGSPAKAAAQVDWLSDVATTVHLAETLGAMQWAFDTTLQWAFDRYSFGRPLASYQAIKHRFADMKTWLEASYAITTAAGIALDDGTPARQATVSAAKFYVGRYGGELVQDCVQLHGGLGVTLELDLHLFLRRVSTNAALYGTTEQHARRLTSLLESEAVA